MIRYGGGKFLIIGLVVLAFGVGVLWANSPDRTRKIADELVEATDVLPENEGKLVIVSGTPVLANGHIVDEEANLEVENAVSYSRVPLQKVYALRSREVVVDKGEDKMSDVDDTTKTEYYVVKDWIYANQERDAEISRTSVTYENPPAINLSSSHASGDMRICGFKTNYSDVSGYVQTEDAWFTQEELEQACGEYIVRSEIDLKAVTDEYGRGMLSSGDEIGDVRVTFSYETFEGAEPVTLIGRQKGDALVLEDDGLVSEAEQVQPGAVTKEEFVAAITAEDASSRRIGIGALILGALVFLLAFNWGALIKPKVSETKPRRPSGR